MKKVGVRNFGSSKSTISIEHCNREANKVAYEVARLAMASKLSCNWVDEPLALFEKTLVNDVTLFEDP